MDGVRIESNFANENNSGDEDEMNNAIEDANHESITLPNDVKIKPCIGMEFNSYAEAYAFYNDYAKEVGFGSSVKLVQKKRQ